MTNVVILASSLEEEGDTGSYPAVDFLNKDLKEISYGASFVEVSSHAGGNKCMERLVFLSAFGSNYDAPEFVALLSRTPWACRESVQVFASEHEQNVFVQIFGPACGEVLSDP